MKAKYVVLILLIIFILCYIIYNSNLINNIKNNDKVKDININHQSNYAKGPLLNLDSLNNKYEEVKIPLRKIPEGYSYYNTLLSVYKKKAFLRNYQSQLKLHLISKLQNTKDKEISDIIKKNINKINNLKYVYKRIRVALLNSEYGLCSIIGHINLKNKIAYIILAFSRNYKTFSERANNMLLLGDSGVGKTKGAQVVGFTLSNCMLLVKNNTIITTSTDFIAQYVGHTAKQTRELIEKSYESVLFIDEAYGLGTNIEYGSSNSFAKEAVTELVAQLDKLNGKIIVICAGYSDDMMNNFLRSNQGLARRFSIKITLTGFNEKEMSDIFIQRMLTLDSNLDIDQDIKNAIYSYFIYLNMLYPESLSRHADSVIDLANDTYDKMIVLNVDLKSALSYSFNINNE